ncbi:MAG: hypothetical protein F6K48_32190 [Okeania sp. SIO3H1]|uniref:hypothetical protein n=1 Tax=Okeania sp. SIO1I7 TaxID=2607772 RepID=UPI0013CCE9D3|nr:hypothetical protein [Okeania sp. SIO1I7]NEN93292.1 hypothetical protein [Okeania sp. SIO3H1]NET24039.1 hypothetical protein [Okeania sp. SIO1I7]
MESLLVGVGDRRQPTPNPSQPTPNPSQEGRGRQEKKEFRGGRSKNCQNDFSAQLCA